MRGRCHVKPQFFAHLLVPHRPNFFLPTFITKAIVRFVVTTKSNKSSFSYSTFFRMASFISCSVQEWFTFAFSLMNKTRIKGTQLEGFWLLVDKLWGEGMESNNEIESTGNIWPDRPWKRKQMDSSRIKLSFILLNNSKTHFHTDKFFRIQ